MKHISAVPFGYLFRKTVNGKLYQRHFSDLKYGDNHAALKAAQSYREDLLEEVKGIPSFQSHNRMNITGIVGVVWNLRHNSYRNDAFVHLFRAKVDGEYRTLSRAWSVQRYGLWHAYELSAQWRHRVAFGKAMKSADILDAFLIFLHNLVDEMQNAGTLKIAMKNALVDLAIDPSIPEEALKAAETLREALIKS